MRPLGHKTAVVSGVTSGIGAALAARLLSAGMTVVGIGRSRERLAHVADRFAPLSGTFAPWTVDLAQAPGRQSAFAELARMWPSVDLIVNNAAACVYESPLALAYEGWSEILETNLLAIVDLVRALAPALKRGAHVINVSSVVARSLPGVRFSPYALTKGAVDRLTDALRLELQPRGIKVSVVAPGLVDTPIYDKVAGFQPVRAKLEEQVPEWLDADDVADAIHWVVTRPERVVISEIAILPLAQAR